MNTIEVNHRALREVAEAITTYCSKQDSEMHSADAHIKTMLANDWIGLDAEEFGHKWEGVDDSDSTAIKFRESLRGFGECLVACADEYEKAQADAYNEANRLPK